VEANISVNYMLKTAFDYELRNYVDIQLMQLNNIEENTEDELTEIRTLNIIKEYLLKRIGNLRT
jgi:hypothetical protein